MDIQFMFICYSILNYEDPVNYIHILQFFSSSCFGLRQSLLSKPNIIYSKIGIFINYKEISYFSFICTDIEIFCLFIQSDQINLKIKFAEGHWRPFQPRFLTRVWEIGCIGILLAQNEPSLKAIKKICIKELYFLDGMVEKFYINEAKTGIKRNITR